jgi:hypothetical protein
MAITSIKTGSSFTNLIKYNDFLGPNAPFIPTDFESIATLTASGGETSLTFSSIPSTYKHLQLRILAKDTTNNTDDAGYSLRFNGISTTVYDFHRLKSDGSTASANGTVNQSSMSFTYGAVASGAAAASMFGVGIIDIHDYTDTSKNKTVRALVGSNINSTGTSTGIALNSGLWRSTAAISSITFLPNLTAFAAGSTFSLYGIKG